MHDHIGCLSVADKGAESGVVVCHILILDIDSDVGVYLHELVRKELHCLILVEVEVGEGDVLAGHVLVLFVLMSASLDRYELIVIGDIGCRTSRGI